MRRMRHDKPHEHGVVINTDLPNEVEGAYFWAATPEDARATFEKMFGDATERKREAGAPRVVGQLIVGGGQSARRGVVFRSASAV